MLRNNKDKLSSCYVTYFRHTLSHLVTHQVTSYFVYYFVQVLFRGLPPFRTMSPFIVICLPCLPVALFVFRSISSHCCLPWPHLSFLCALGTWLHFQCNQVPNARKNERCGQGRQQYDETEWKTNNVTGR